jgi:DNA-binding FadR family transcriptional regulator
MKKRSTKLLPVKIADAFREEILAAEEGTYLGSEDELVARFNVSHPTFRQTARLLEQERILEVRRGQGGGYFVKVPAVSEVARTSGSYLRARKSSARQVFRAVRDALQEIGRAAARASDPEVLAQLRQVRDELASLSGERSIPDGALERVIVRLHRTLIKLANDPVSELIVTMLNHVADEGLRSLMPKTDSAVQQQYIQLNIFLADFVLAREPDLAAAAFARFVDFTFELMSSGDRASDQ